ncbi:hypothetical protein C8J57DRAFT_1210210 [Mycena rebaudengoi]|nr:hypothetical protein C8J57DRAFT_1210210 [Mycena rebaudengoi]
MAGGRRAQTGKRGEAKDAPLVSRASTRGAEEGWASVLVCTLGEASRRGEDGEQSFDSGHGIGEDERVCLCRNGLRKGRKGRANEDVYVWVEGEGAEGAGERNFDSGGREEARGKGGRYGQEKGRYGWAKKGADGADRRKGEKGKQPREDGAVDRTDKVEKKRHHIALILTHTRSGIVAHISPSHVASHKNHSIAKLPWIVGSYSTGTIVWFAPVALATIRAPHRRNPKNAQEEFLIFENRNRFENLLQNLELVLAHDGLPQLNTSEPVPEPALELYSDCP